MHEIETNREWITSKRARPLIVQMTPRRFEKLKITKGDKLVMRVKISGTKNYVDILIENPFAH